MVAAYLQSSCSHTCAPSAVGCSSSNSVRARIHCSMNSRDCASIVCMSKGGQSYHVEVEVSEEEDPEGVYKRFKNSCNLAGLVYESRRRKFFENPQDVKKRKQQEKGQRKMRDMRERFLQTYDDAHSDTPPFTDMFAADEDIYDVLGSVEGEEGTSRTWSPGGRTANGHNSRVQQKGNANGQRENVTMRSVPSQGPKQPTDSQTSVNTNGKPKAQVQTARARRAAKQKVIAEGVKGAHENVAASQA